MDKFLDVFIDTIYIYIYIYIKIIKNTKNGFTGRSKIGNFKFLNFFMIYIVTGNKKNMLIFFKKCLSFY